MAVVHYKRYEFRQPLDVSPVLFHQLKQQLSENPTAVPDAAFNTTFISHFRKTLWRLAISAALFVILLVTYLQLYPVNATQFEPRRLALMIPIFISGFTAAITLGAILLEGPSLASYITERTNYYGRLKHAVKESADYPAFEKSFFPASAPGGIKKEFAFEQAWLEEKKQKPVSADSLLTRFFRLMHLHYWKLALLAFIIFLLVKYLF